MAQTTTMTTYDQKGIREQLLNVIYQISPTDTPVMSSIQRGVAMTNTFMEWQQDALPTAAVNFNTEGADVNFRTTPATTRLRNYSQISDDGLKVSGTAQAVTTAGREEELAYQISQSGAWIKTCMEVQISGNYASAVGTNATARRCAGIEAWITTNGSRGTGGTDGGYTAAGTVTAATDATSTNQRTFTETRLKAAIKDCWTSGGDPTMVIVGPVNKQKASAFAGISTKYQDFGANPSSGAGLSIVATADFYVSDFGKHKIVPSRFSRERTALVLDLKYWSMHYLRPFFVQDIAKTGDAEKRQLLVEYSLCARHQGASATVADLTTT